MRRHVLVRLGRGIATAGALAWVTATACSSPRNAGGAGTASTEETKEPRMDSSTQRTDVEKLAHVTLSAATAHLQTHVERGVDGAVWARFELPAAEIDGFLASAGYLELSTRQRFVENWHLPTKPPWWTPDAIATFRSGQIRHESAKPRYAGHILVSGDGDPRTVYLFVTGL
jgi:hypothetical protein